MTTERAGPVTPFVVRAAILACAVLIPLRIIALGYIPRDDALRHAAKAVSGRPWSDILVLRPDLTVVDSHPGWHALLGMVHAATGADALALVWLSVALLFVLVSAAPLALLRRPEAWMAALLLLAVADWPVVTRLMQGRPFLWSTAVVVALCFLWPRLEGDRMPLRWTAAAGLLVASATWIHAAWYLFVLPVAACVVARRGVVARRLAVATAAGVVLGAVLTGQPIAFFRQMLLHGFVALGHREPASTLAAEFLPFTGAPLMVLATVVVLLGRGTRRSGPPLGRDPVFVLAVMGWALGFVAIRFWSDWGAAALLVWLARELQEVMESQVAEGSGGRTAAAAVLSLTALLALTADAHGRWSATDRTYAPLLRREARPFLPDDGGILYSGDMRIFFETFFRYPGARWRYIVGFEPGLMPPEDLAVYRQLLKNLTPEAPLPWVRKMRPEDRFIIATAGAEPPVPGLEWRHVGGTFWSGRVPGGSPSGSPPGP